MSVSFSHCSLMNTSQLVHVNVHMTYACTRTWVFTCDACTLRFLVPPVVDAGPTQEGFLALFSQCDGGVDGLKAFPYSTHWNLVLVPVQSRFNL